MKPTLENDASMESLSVDSPIHARQEVSVLIGSARIAHGLVTPGAPTSATQRKRDDPTGHVVSGWGRPRPGTEEAR